MNTYCLYLSQIFRARFYFFFVASLLAMVSAKSVAGEPVITGDLGSGWELGELLYEESFDDSSKWEVQIEESSSSLVPDVKFENGVLDMYIPARGATAWLKEKLEGPVVVVYDVVIPEETLSGSDVRVGDVNTFLNATDPTVEDRILDDTFYTGAFSSYGKMNGYYASTGGGQNTTTRMRRYPRTDVDGNAVTHLVMNELDGQAEYLLTAGQTHSIQFAAANGQLQYVFDGKVVYEMKEGDVVSVERPDGAQNRATVYDFETYPEYTGGYFGFRMLRSHHQYSGLKVYRLVRGEKAEVTVSTLAELREAVTHDNQNIVMTPGDYNLETGLPSGSRNLICSGDSNIINLTGVYIKVPVGSVSENYLIISGDYNTWIGGEVEDTYRNGLTEITDFSAYNQDRVNLAHGLGGDPVMRIEGDGNLVEGIKLTVRGSYPYGYGSIYGIGAGNTFGLNKRCGILITGGANNTLDGVEVQQRAFGHGIFVQSGADGSVIKNSLVEGRVRAFAELYDETETYDLPYRSNYTLPQVDGTPPVPTDEVTSLCEDGYRMYNNTGSVDVINCVAKKMRGGIRLYLGGSATVTDSMAIDCGDTNFNMPSGGTIVNSSGNFAYAPLSDFRLGRSNMDIEWTIIPSPHAVGPHNLCDIQGNGHTIVFHRTEGPLDTDLRPIVVTGSGSVIRNETEYPIILEASASGNTVVSVGPVTDNGSNNEVCTDIEECGDMNCGGEDPFGGVEVEDFCEESGTQLEETTDLEGGLNAGYIENGDWMKFDSLDFERGAIAFNARVASKTIGGNIEVRLGSSTGDLVGTATVAPTGGWQNWETVSVDLDYELEGVHDVVIVFTGGASYLFNINWISFDRSADNVNFALDGTATQSSTDYEGEAARAIDGNKDGVWENSSVTHTANEMSPWWEVDLGTVHNIGDIVVSPRTDECCTYRLSLFTVSVLDGDRNEVYSKSYDRELKTDLVVSPRGVEGQIVRVQLEDENPLSLAEVGVYPYIDVDSDGDGDLDSVDTDDDNDGYLDEDDLFPTDPNEWADMDGDDIGDNSDTDNDNDGVDDVDDAFPLDPIEWADTDGDGTGDNADEDDDNDGFADVDDLFPLDPTDWADEDGDGIGDNSEEPGEFVNISTRAFVTDGNGIVIGGIVIEGSDPMLTLIQGVGSELGENPFGLGDALMDTEITLYKGDVEIGSNDDWDSDSEMASDILDAGVVAGSFVLEAGGKSAALLVELEPGAYTVHFSGKNGASGVGLVEVYNVSTKMD